MKDKILEINIAAVNYAREEVEKDISYLLISLTRAKKTVSMFRETAQHYADISREEKNDAVTRLFYKDLNRAGNIASTIETVYNRLTSCKKEYL